MALVHSSKRDRPPVLSAFGVVLGHASVLNLVRTGRLLLGIWAKSLILLTSSIISAQVAWILYVVTLFITN